MKIAFIVDEFPNLSETFILNQITGLIDLGHEVEIFSGARPEEGIQHPEIKEYNLTEHTFYHNEAPPNIFPRIVKALFLGVCYIFIHPVSVIRSLNIFKYGRDALSLYLFYKVILFMKEGRFDIIQCHFGPNGNLGATLKEIGIQGKIVTMFHGYDIRRGIKLGAHIYDKLFRLGDCFLAISEYTAKCLYEFGVDRKKIIHHSVGIDPDKFSLKTKTPLSDPSEPAIILTVARLKEEKGLPYAIKAIKELKQRNPQSHIEYQIVGDGFLRDTLNSMAKSLKMEKYVKFFGAQSHRTIIDLLEKAHIFLLPSNVEVLPVVLMEAQASGLPVVATSVGAVSEIVDNGKSGFLVPRKDVGKMVEKLEYLIENPKIGAAMGKEGREKIESLFDIKKLNRRLVEIYKSII